MPTTATTTAARTATRLASDRQLAFIDTLLTQRVVTPTDRAKLDAAYEHFTTATASQAITWLLAQPKVPAVAPAARAATAPVTPGMYRTADGTMYRAYLGQQSGKILAKRLVGTDGHWSFEYAGMADRFVTTDQRMTLEEAKAWGKTTGTCCNCGRRLDVPESVDAGIGPVCASKI